MTVRLRWAKGASIRYTYLRFISPRQGGSRVADFQVFQTRGAHVRGLSGHIAHLFSEPAAVRNGTFATSGLYAGLCQYASGRFRGAWRRGGYRLGAWALGRDPAWGCRAGRIGGLRCGLCAVRFGCRARELCPADFWRNGGASACRLYGGALSCLGGLSCAVQLAPGAFVAGGYGGRGGAGGAAALIGHLRRGAYRVRGARSAFVLGALLVGMARAFDCGQGSRGGGIEVGADARCHGPAEADGAGGGHAVCGPYGVRLHDGGAQVRPVRRGAYGGARLRAGRRGGASHLPHAHARSAHAAHLSGAGAPVRAAADLPELFSRVDRPHVVRRLDELCVLRRRGHFGSGGSRGGRSRLGVLSGPHLWHDGGRVFGLLLARRDSSPDGSVPD